MAVATIKPLTSEAIALTEKKMDMALDEIINMSKKPSQQRTLKNHRIFGFRCCCCCCCCLCFDFTEQKPGGGVRGNPMKVKQFMDSGACGALAQRRSDFQANNHFPLATEVAKKAGVAPVCSRPFNSSRQANNWNKQRHYRKGLRSDPEHGELKKAYFGLKNLFKKTKSAEDNESKGKFGMAVEDFMAALAMDPSHNAHNVHLRLGLCKVQIKLGRGKDALDSCTEALKIDEELVEALAQRDEAKLLTEDWE
ncbi:hypothetical protein MKW94_016986 [Papaver nudicaule]|uniref:Uncharacterized protein n=1 Tax=Papaver nudicaule TaxID=74823 RepID=A0AA42ATF5_PAPNU|nr:hypothetical protein [Papaver nudicaule]